MARCSAYIALLLLLIGQISAAPESDPPPSTAACKDQNLLSNRLDAVEKRVEDTVQKLEEELAGLLDAVETPELSFILNSNSAGPVVDILDESNPKLRS